MSLDILQHQIERFGMVTVMDVILFDIVKDEPVLLLDTLKISSIDVESEEKEIKGGLYADRLVAYDYGREANVTFQDALLSFSSMKHLWGADIERTEGDNVIEVHQVFRQGLKTLGSGEEEYEIELPYEPKFIDAVLINGESIEIDGVSVTDKKLTFDAVVEKEEEVIVMYRAELAAPGAAESIWEPVQARLTSNKFPKTVKLVGKTFIIQEKTGQKIEAEIEFPKLKLNANFSLSLEAEGDASVFDFGGLALAHGPNKDLFIIKALGLYED